MNFSTIGKSGIAALAAAGLALSAPAEARDLNITIGKDGDLLEKLIEMDADDIADMREEFADARNDIDDAISDIADARAEAKAAPGGAFFLKIAFAAASAATDASVNSALDEVQTELDRAERELKTADVSAEERLETQEAIETLRDELATLRVKLDELIDSMRA